MTHRFFVSPDQLVEGHVLFDQPTTHQLIRVLRLRPGSRVSVLDNSGQEYEVELVELQSRRAVGQVVDCRQVDTEPTVSLTLYACLLKGDHFEWVLQKGVELGVCAVVPLISERTMLQDRDRADRKRSRWQEIIREAAEQSHRARLPILRPALSLAEAYAQARAHDLALILWEQAQEPDLVQTLQIAVRPSAAGLFIGPEGGFSQAEIDLARQHGIQAVTCGPRILRAETAALAAIAVIMAVWGEMRMPARP